MVLRSSSAEGRALPGVVRVSQVKIPVADLGHSVAWYSELLGLVLRAEFVEQGVVRGAVLVHPGADFAIALRDRSVSASRPVLRGFDVCAIEVDSRTALEELQRRCRELSVDVGAIEDRVDASVLDVPDPDGTVLRFRHSAADLRGPFAGFEFTDEGIRTYDQPRLGVRRP